MMVKHLYKQEQSPKMVRKLTWSTFSMITAYDMVKAASALAMYVWPPLVLKNYKPLACDLWRYCFVFILKLKIFRTNLCQWSAKCSRMRLMIGASPGSLNDSRKSRSDSSIRSPAKSKDWTKAFKMFKFFRLDKYSPGNFFIRSFIEKINFKTPLEMALGPFYYCIVGFWERKRDCVKFEQQFE